MACSTPASSLARMLAAGWPANSGGLRSPWRWTEHLHSFWTAATQMAILCARCIGWQTPYASAARVLSAVRWSSPGPMLACSKSGRMPGCGSNSASLARSQSNSQRRWSRMRLVRYGERGQERPGLLDPQGSLRDLSGVVRDIDGAALLPDSLDRLRA